MKYLAMACLLLVTTCVVLLLRDVDRKVQAETVTQIDAAQINKLLVSLNDPQNGLPAILADAHRTELITSGAITNIEKTTRQWQSKQNTLSDQTLQDEKSLNGVLVSLDGTTASLSNLITTQTSSLSSLETSASKSITAITTLSDTVNARIGPILDQAEQTSANVADTTASVDTSAHDIQAFIHRETTPARGTWHVIKGFLESFAGPAASVATAIK